MRMLSKLKAWKGDSDIGKWCCFHGLLFFIPAWFRWSWRIRDWAQENGRFGEVWSTRGLSISYDLEDVGKSGFNQIGRQPGDMRCGFIDLRWTD